MKIRGARIGLPSRMNLVAGRLTCNPAGFGFVVPDARRPGAARRLRLRREPEGGAPRRPRRGARRARHPEGARGTHHPRPGARPSRIVGRYESDGRFGGHVVPFDRARPPRALHPARRRRRAPSRARWCRPRSRVLPRATRNPSGRVLQGPGAPRGPGRRPEGRHGEVRAPRRVPRGRRGRGRARPGDVGPEDVAGRTDFRPWADRDRRPRDGPRPRRRHQPRPPAERPLAPGRPHRRRGPLRPRGHAAGPGGLPARHLGLLPGPRRAHAAPRPLEPHLQPRRRAKTA